MKYAKIVNGVVEVIRVSKPSKKRAKDFIECPEDVFAGFKYAGGKFTAPRRPVRTRQPAPDRDAAIRILGKSLTGKDRTDFNAAMDKTQ